MSAEILTAQEKPPTVGDFMIWVGKTSRNLKPFHRVMVCELPRKIPDPWAGYRIYSDTTKKCHTSRALHLIWPESLAVFLAENDWSKK